MHKLFYNILYPFLLLSIYIISCNTTNNNWHKNNVDTIVAAKPQVNTTKQTANFNAVLQKIYFNKKQLQLYYTTSKNENFVYAKQQFLYLFENLLLPQWVGTKWDFNGTTQIPQQGAIACGYFVTTTLQQIQVPINRVKLGQAASETMMLNLTSKAFYNNYSNLSFDAFIHKLKTQKPFLAIVGLDKHTGYLLNNGKELYFVHSSYIKSRGVIKQIASQSPELKSSKWRSVGYISNDDNFIKKWLAI